MATQSSSPKNKDLIEITLESFSERFQFEQELIVADPEIFPRVILATDSQKQAPVAIKIFPEGGSRKQQPHGRLKKKIEAVSHPNLIGPTEEYLVVNQIEGKTSRAFEASVYEHIRGGNLLPLLGTKLPEHNLKWIITGILSGLKALHTQKIIHGNLKPTNILIQDVGHPHVRLSDFGITADQTFEDLNVKFPPGSIKYLAPEMLDPEGFLNNKKLGIEVDFWALGVILFELLTGTYPFGIDKNSNTEIASRICLADLSKLWAMVPQEFRPFFEACLDRIPANRPRSVQEVLKLLPQEVGGKQKPVSTSPQKKATTRIKTLFSSPKPEKIACRHCGNLNNSKSIICSSCKNPLKGPASLSQYRSPASIGAWTILFFTLFLVPFGIGYWELFQICESSGKNCLQVLLESDAQQGILEGFSVFDLISGVFMLFSLLMYHIFFIWWLVRISDNISALGSKNVRTEPYYLLSTLLILLLFVPVIRDYLGSKTLIFAALLILYQIITSLLTLQVIWKASNPVFLQNNEAWKKSKGSFLVLSRWALSFLFPVFLLLPFIPINADMTFSKPWFFFGVVMSALYWLISISVIMRINLRQKAKFLALAKR